MNQDHDMSLTKGATLPFMQKIGLAIGLGGLLILFLSLMNFDQLQGGFWLWTSLLGILIGVVLYTHSLYAHHPIGIKNNHVWHYSISSRGVLAWIAGLVLTVFYVIIYWYPSYLGLASDGGANTGIVSFFDPLSYALNGKAASQWFVYGTLYTVAILSFGYKFIMKYRHNKYQVVRTISVMFFQLGFAFLIPELLSKMNPDKAYFAKDIKNMWPLNYYFFEEWHLKNMIDGGSLGMFMLIGGIALIFIISPILTYFYGKRWYCSWVCGCGGLAETAGDAFRQLSDKSLKAWKFERWSIHLVLVFIMVTTIAVIYSFLGNNPDYSIITKSQFVYGIAIFLAVVVGSLYIFKREDMDKDAVYTMLSLTAIILISLLFNYFYNSGHAMFIDSSSLKQWYGFFIGAAFSGVIGVGFYPLMGSRVWCRFGCPMAAILGLQQRLFSRFRITTNGGQCISCGNCSTYCEMGIDVRAYAQKGQNIVRSSCVGCGICSAVCPRGVLKLENDVLNGRIEGDGLIGNDMDIFEMLEAKKRVGV